MHRPYTVLRFHLARAHHCRHRYTLMTLCNGVRAYCNFSVSISWWVAGWCRGREPAVRKYRCFTEGCLQLSNFMTVFYVYSLYVMVNTWSYQVPHHCHDSQLPVPVPPHLLRLETRLPEGRVNLLICPYNGVPFKCFTILLFTKLQRTVNAQAYLGVPYLVYYITIIYYYYYYSRRVT